MATDPITAIRNISEVVKKFNDIELMKQIVELQSAIFELERENLSLKKQLEQRLELKMNGPHGYYFRDGDEVPFCPKCLEGEGKAVHLPAAEDYFSGHGRICGVCKHRYTEGPREKPMPTHIAPRRTPWM